MVKLLKAQRAGGKMLDRLITHRRKRVFQFLVLPALVSVYIVGWILYWLGLK